MTTTPKTPTLAGSDELATALKVNKSTVWRWANQPDFPAPIAELRMGKVWDLDAVLAWRDARALGAA